LPKGIYQRYRTIGTGELRHYSKSYVRRVTYAINPTEDNVNSFKALFPSWLQNTPFKKGTPKVYFDRDTLVYEYKGKPTIYFDVRTGAFKVKSQDFKKYGKIVCSNQAHFVFENIKKCSDDMASGSEENAYIKEAKWHKRKRRPKVPYDPTQQTIWQASNSH